MSTSEENAAGKKITLRSSDGMVFEVDEAVALESQLIKHMFEDDCPGDTVPLPNVTGEILAMVIVYCKCHVQCVDDIFVTDDDIKAFDTEFVNVDQATLFNLILAANYLDIKNLLDLTCQTVADMIKGKTTEEIRRTFDFDNDLPPDQEEKLRLEHRWAFK